MKKAIFCGTFAPMTLGHLDVLKKAGRIFDKVYVAVPEVSGKTNGFSLSSRIKIARASVESLPFAEVVSFSGLLPDFCRALDTYTLVRGLRSTIDYVYEGDLLRNYQALSELIDCVYILPSPSHQHISSSLVREILLHGGDIKNHVSKNALELIKDSFER